MISDQTLQLRDGRTLGYTEFGNATGYPVLLFHGHPGSRIFQLPLAANISARVLCLERPGYGRSSFHVGRTFLDWADDVLDFANQLKLDRFAVAGYSGGGPHALVCAFKYPKRISAVASVSGCAPYQVKGVQDGVNSFNRWMYNTAANAPQLIQTLFAPIGWLSKLSIKPFTLGFSAMLSKADRHVIAPELETMLAQHLHEAFRQGSRGFSYEASLLGKPWGFAVQDIRVPTHVWQGTADHNVSLAMGEYLAANIPKATRHIIQNEGHLGVLFRYWQTIMKQLLESQDH